MRIVTASCALVRGVGLTEQQNMAEYTLTKGQYRKRELSLLATSLGFPGSLLVSRFQAHYSASSEADDEERTVSEKMVTGLLSSGSLFKKLEKVFNRHPAWYNVKLFRKAMQHIRHRSLCFRDISDARIAFELYASESGMAAELHHVQRALKMMERAASPSQLQLEIQRFHDVSDVPSRLQLYEFMDIVALCGKTDELDDERRLSELSLCDGTLSASGSRQEVADFDQILMTRDQKVSAFLEAGYKRKLRGRLNKRDNNSAEKPETSDDQIVRTDSRKSLVSLAVEQSRAVTPCLERSQSQLHGSRCGFHALSGEQYKSVLPIATSPRPSLPIMNPTKQSRVLSRRRTHSTEDPLAKEGYSYPHSVTHHSPVRVHLHHHQPQRNQFTDPSLHTRHTEYTVVGTEIGREINDICADSVIKARETLHSSLSAFSSLNISLPEQPPPPGARVNSTKKKRKNSYSCREAAGFYLEPIVTREEREEHQFLVDNLLWSRRRAKKHYQVIQ